MLIVLLLAVGPLLRALVSKIFLIVAKKVLPVSWARFLLLCLLHLRIALISKSLLTAVLLLRSS